MGPLGGYLLGLLTILLILIPFWFVAMSSPTFRRAYQGTICYRICTGT